MVKKNYLLRIRKLYFLNPEEMIFSKIFFRNFKIFKSTKVLKIQKYEI